MSGLRAARNGGRPLAQYTGDGVLRGAGGGVLRRAPRMSARLSRAAAAAVFGLAAVSPAMAQCAMCSVSKGDSPAATHALLAGALVLIIPTAGIIGGFLYLTWKFRDPGN